MPILNSEFSGLLYTSSRYLFNIGKGSIQDKISEGKIVDLQKMSSYDVDKIYKNSYLNAALTIFKRTAAINMIMGLTVFYSYFCRVMLSKGIISQFGLLNKLDFLANLPIAGIGCYIGVVLCISELCVIICDAIGRHMRAKSSLNCKIKFYNRDVDHINKCIEYIVQHPNQFDINRHLSRYISSFYALFRSPDLINVRPFVESIEKQVEAALVSDLSNGLPNNTNNMISNPSLLSIFPEGNGGKSREDLLCRGIEKANLLMHQIGGYCLKEKFLVEDGDYRESMFGLFVKIGVIMWLIATMFIQFCPGIILVSMVASILVSYHSGLLRNIVTRCKDDTKLHNMALSNVSTLNDLQKEDARTERHSEYVLQAQSRLDKALDI